MADYERYNTRNVAQKEIYDSYMGILRISPNEINNSDVDDPTQILNTLYDEEQKQRTKIILSDSDGNVLPITFQPRAFTTTTLYRDPKTGVDSYKTEDILHIATIVNEGKGYIFASQNFTQRGSVIIEKDKDLDSRHSIVRILSGGESANSSGEKAGEGWLLYPTESPNDSNYFNDKNKHQLFDKNNTTTPRHKQVDETLYTWTADKHNTFITGERVKVAGRYVTTNNQFNEEIPVYYTRDYILGHYDGHQISSEVLNNMFQRWGIDGKSNEGFTDYVTKLSWTRFDKLIWDTLHEVLTGNIRHFKGRYDELGLNQSAEPGIRDKIGIKGNTYKEYAPILGTEMPRGIIMYHAMPFHRYWYYRTRQALRGFIERKKSSLVSFSKAFEDSDYDSLDKWIIESDETGGLLINDNFEKDDNDNNNLIKDEITKLSEFFKNGRITPCSTSTVGFAHSLAKNFVLCNGRTVNFANFPNLSLTNEVIFDTTLKDEDGNVIDSTTGRLASYNSDYGFDINNDYENTALGAVGTSSTGNSGVVKTPNLFALFESTPRFIRGLNWRVLEKLDNSNVEVYDPFSGNYIHKKTQDDLQLDMDTNDVPMEICKVNIDSMNEDAAIYKLKKDIKTTSIPFLHTYDHFVEKAVHYHNMFSSIFGGTTGTLNDQLHYYHCTNTRGGHLGHVYKWLFNALMNVDRTFSKTDMYKTPSTFYAHISDNEAWRDMNYLNYNFDGIYRGNTYKKFTPIPNLGLITFNAGIFNNKGEADTTIEKYEDENGVIQNVTRYGDRGTLKYIENYVKNDISPSLTDEIELYYTDGESIGHPLSNAVITPEAEGNKSDILGKEVDMVYIENATESNSDFVKAHNAEKERRKFMAIKMNEAEGFIPISMAGKGSGLIILGWSRDERRGLKAASRNTYHDHKYNVASYVMTAYEDGSEYPSENHYWRCWSSVAYLNANKLGVGDVKNYINNRKNFNEETDYYDINSVTQLPSNEKFRTFNYGGVRVTVDETCPTPPYLNLLPLIRI